MRCTLVRFIDFTGMLYITSRLRHGSPTNQVSEKPDPKAMLMMWTLACLPSHIAAWA